MNNVWMTNTKANHIETGGEEIGVIDAVFPKPVRSNRFAKVFNTKAGNGETGAIKIGLTKPAGLKLIKAKSVLSKPDIPG